MAVPSAVQAAMESAQRYQKMVEEEQKKKAGTAGVVGASVGAATAKQAQDNANKALAASAAPPLAGYAAMNSPPISTMSVESIDFAYA